MSYAQAVLLLSGSGLHVAGANNIAAAQAAAASIAPGTVVAQSPAAGHLVTTADNIWLSVMR